MHPRVAMRILRHSKINVTMEIYTEAPSEATVEALRKLGDQLRVMVAAVCCCRKIKKAGPMFETGLWPGWS